MKSKDIKPQTYASIEHSKSKSSPSFAEIKQSTKHYSDEKFWQKLNRIGRGAGRTLLKQALMLYYIARSSKTPKPIKLLIIGGLGYLISMIDAVPDIMPVVGLLDDAGVLALIFASVARYINPNIETEVNKRLKNWFDKDSAPLQDEGTPRS
ncbi:MAG: YkvA family protein [Pseudomonadota bacterium]